MADDVKGSKLATPDQPHAARSAGEWAETRARLARDRERLRAWFRVYRRPVPRVLALHPSYQCVFLHRLSRCFFVRGRRLIARLLWHLNVALTGADIAVVSEIGGGLIVIHPMTTCIVGTLGRDCTLWGACTIGGGRATRDIGAGPGLPVLGDDVVLEVGCCVVGPVRVGNGARIGPGLVVVKDVPAGTTTDAS